MRYRCGQLAGFCKPALAIGGDYYDFYALPNGRLACVIADVSGKGVGSALLMASVPGTFRSVTGMMDGDLSGTLGRVNESVCDLSTGSKYAAVFLAVLDTATRRLSYVNCGHCEPFVLRGDEVVTLSERGPVIGLLGAAKYEEALKELQPGDLLAGHTGGFREALNDNGDWVADRAGVHSAATETSPLFSAPCASGSIRAGRPPLVSLRADEPRRTMQEETREIDHAEVGTVEDIRRLLAEVRKALRESKKATVSEYIRLLELLQAAEAQTELEVRVGWCDWSKDE